MKALKGIIVSIIFVIFLSGCSDKKQENPVEPIPVDGLTKLLQDAPDEIKAAVAKEFTEEMRNEISKQISNSHHDLLKRGRLFIALIQIGGPPPFFDPNSECAPLLSVGPLAGGGIGTVIGRHTIVQSHCLNPQTFEFTNGKVAMTTISGNHELYEKYFGTLSPTQDPNALLIRGITDFTGGTGRFAGATGSGFAFGKLNPNTGEAVLINISSLYLK